MRKYLFVCLVIFVSCINTNDYFSKPDSLIGIWVSAAVSPDTSVTYSLEFTDQCYIERNSYHNSYGENLFIAEGYWYVDKDDGRLWSEIVSARWYSISYKYKDTTLVRKKDYSGFEAEPYWGGYPYILKNDSLFAYGKWFIKS